MKRPTKPRLPKIEETISFHEWDILGINLKTLFETISALNIPLEQLCFNKEWDEGDEEGVIRLQREYTSDEAKEKFEESIIKYKQDMIDYYKWKTKQLEEE